MIITTSYYEQSEPITHFKDNKFSTNNRQSISCTFGTPNSSTFGISNVSSNRSIPAVRWISIDGVDHDVMIENFILTFSIHFNSYLTIIYVTSIYVTIFNGKKSNSGCRMTC